MAKVAKIKTTENEASVADFIGSVTDEQKRNDTVAIAAMMEKATGLPPKMWGASLIGFGNVRYKSPSSGREVDWFRVGFSPRKANISFHIMGVDAATRTSCLSRLGKHKTDGGCVYINKLADVDLTVLEELITAAAQSGHISE